MWAVKWVAWQVGTLEFRKNHADINEKATIERHLQQLRLTAAP